MDAQFNQPHRASADASLAGNGCLRQSVILGKESHYLVVLRLRQCRQRGPAPVGGWLGLFGPSCCLKQRLVLFHDEFPRPDAGIDLISSGDSHFPSSSSITRTILSWRILTNRGSRISPDSCRPNTETSTMSPTLMLS